MARQKPERTHKTVRDEMLRLLRERVHNPTEIWDSSTKKPHPEYHAGRLLKRAEYFDREGFITIAGMDYYRKETQPIRTWLRANWFGVIVSIIATAATMFAAVSNFLIG